MCYAPHPSKALLSYGGSLFSVDYFFMMSFIRLKVLVISL